MLTIYAIHYYSAQIGTLDGFSFDSEEEGDKLPKPTSHQTNDDEDVEEQPNEKAKGKAKKTSVCFFFFPFFSDDYLIVFLPFCSSCILIG